MSKVYVRNVDDPVPTGQRAIGAKLLTPLGTYKIRFQNALACCIIQGQGHLVLNLRKKQNRDMKVGQ